MNWFGTQTDPVKPARKRNVATKRRLARQALDRWIDAMRDDPERDVSGESDEVARLAATAAREEYQWAQEKR